MQMTYGADVNNDDDLNKKFQRLLPKQTQDVIATGILILIIPFGLFLHFFYVLPTWYTVMSENWLYRVIPILFFAFNLYSNWIFMIRVGPNGRNAILPNVVKSGFRYCHSCHTNSPPRAYHCPVCDICVFRRDHHCSFGAVCVGHFNQRYFVAAALNLLFMTAPLVRYGWDLLALKLEGGITMGRIWQVMLPHVAFILRFISLNQFLHVLIFVFTMTVFLFSIYLVAAQWFCIYNGQTRIEYLMEVHAYQLGFFENIRQSLGTRWPLIAISCFIPSPLPSNGINYVTREIHNAHTKDL
ncbi:unnamed protein product [Caenorhabditis angaria]|uniref:Palmitoyltransferase n=1 Tax=Caenorhabditis angaria TaxID=860376 RepID=A0A9P1NBZ9_9PELO|nr:unnamed protein product [Caenorhabditis angaria]